MPVKVGVVGVGYLGQHHVRLYSEIEDTELTAIVDIDEKRADAFAEKYGCEAYSDYREILDKVDALSIVTPTTSHYNIALDCLRAGKDILIEKPITVNVEEADELIRESEKRGCILQVGHLERYNPAVLTASEMVKEPRFIEAERLSPFLGRGIDVDVTLDLMIHDIDIILSLISSPVKEIRAVGAEVLTSKIDVAKAWLEFENGCIALITASRLSPEKQRRLKVFQKDSYISIDFQSYEVRCYFRTGDDISFDVIKPEHKEPLREELRDFINCVKERKRPKVSATEGRNALKIVLKITNKIKNAK
ncbi:MAG: Gfo/Idh/MocA family oxidoreductase [Nitrospirota bacterium]